MSTPTLITTTGGPIFMGPHPDLIDREPPGTVISLCETPVRYPGQLVFPLMDTLSPNALPNRDAFERFIDTAHTVATHGVTYWHCHRGLNRSGFAVAAYLVRHRRHRISAAISRLRRLRSPLVLQNEVFERTLRQWYGDADEQEFEPVDTTAGVDTPPRSVDEVLPMPPASMPAPDAVVLHLGRPTWP